jgi:hypothetical protein
LSVKEEKNQSLAVAGTQELSMIKPNLSIADAQAAMEYYQQLTAAILVPWNDRKVLNGVIIKESDYQRFLVKEDGKQLYRDRVKKSGWRKIATAYSVSLSTPLITRRDRTDNSFVIRAEVVASRMGRTMPGSGNCDSREISDERKKEHNTYAIAETRAINRAISDLIGFGEVSAEEMTDGGALDNARVIESTATFPDEQQPPEPKKEEPKNDKPASAPTTLPAIGVPTSISGAWVKATLEQLGVNTESLDVKEELEDIIVVKKAQASIPDAEWKAISQLNQRLKGSYTSKPIQWRFKRAQG